MSDHDYELSVIGGGPPLQRVSPARRENQVCAHDLNLTFVSGLRVIKCSAGLLLRAVIRLFCAERLKRIGFASLSCSYCVSASLPVRVQR